MMMEAGGLVGEGQSHSHLCSPLPQLTVMQPSLFRGSRAGHPKFLPKARPRTTASS